MNKLTVIIAAVIIFSGCGKDNDNTENHIPRAVMSISPLRAEANDPIQFDATAVSDKEDATDKLEVKWSWNGDDDFTAFSAEKTEVYSYQDEGVYFPKLVVKDTKDMTDTTHGMVVIVYDLENLPPSIPLLVSPPEWQTWMEPTIIFKWRSGIDPEGDSLSYDLWIGKSKATMKLHRPDVDYYSMVDGEKQYETTETGFQLNQDYYWQVAAKDQNGNYTLGHTWKFTTRP